MQRPTSSMHLCWKASSATKMRTRAFTNAFARAARSAYLTSTPAFVSTGAAQLSLASRANSATCATCARRPISSRASDVNNGTAANGVAKAARRTRDDVAPEGAATEAGFSLVQERVLFRRYQTVWERDVAFPDGKRVSFDVLGSEQSNFQSVFVFPFNSHARTVTALREYAPGSHTLAHSFVAGMYEPDKHASLEDAARAELSEEAQLKGGTLVPLASAPDGIAADKYSRNRFHYYLGIDCVRDDDPRQADFAEYITVAHGYSLADVRALIADGAFNTPSSLLGMLALDELRRRGFE